MRSYIGESGSAQLMKKLNMEKVFRLILMHRPVSRIQLSKLSGLNKVTVSSCVEYLLNYDVIREIGVERGNGRPAMMLDLNENFGILLSMEFNTICSRMLATDINGKELYSVKVPPEEINGLEGFVKRAKEFCKICEQKIPDTRMGVVGASISFPNNYNSRTGVIEYLASMPECSGFPLRDEIRKALPDIPLYMQHSGTAGAVGEVHFGSSTPTAYMAYLYVSWGMNLAMYQAGTMHSGFRGFAGRFGHTIIQRGGRQCVCGNRGCIETYASIHALLENIYPDQAEQMSHDGVLRYQLVEQVRKRIDAHDEKVYQALEDVCDSLAIGLANIINFCNPEQVCVGGYLASMINDELFARVVEKTKELLPAHIKQDVVFSRSEMGENGAVYGGIATVRDNIVGFLMERELKEEYERKLGIIKGEPVQENF